MASFFGNSSAKSHASMLLDNFGRYWQSCYADDDLDIKSDGRQAIFTPRKQASSLGFPRLILEKGGSCHDQNRLSPTDLATGSEIFGVEILCEALPFSDRKLLKSEGMVRKQELVAMVRQLEPTSGGNENSPTHSPNFAGEFNSYDDPGTEPLKLVSVFQQQVDRYVANNETGNETDSLTNRLERYTVDNMLKNERARPLLIDSRQGTVGRCILCPSINKPSEGIPGRNDDTDLRFPIHQPVFNHLLGLYDLQIAPEWRGKGLGSQFVEILVRVSSQLNFTHLGLFCSPQLAEFYQRHGFRESCQLERWTKNASPFPLV